MLPLPQSLLWVTPHPDLTFSPSLGCPCSPIPMLRTESEDAQSCPILCDPVDCSLPGSSIHGILQARILEWVTISFSKGSSQLGDRTRVFGIAGNHFSLLATRESPRQAIHKELLLRLHLWGDLRGDIQGPCSVRFSGQEFCIAQSSPGARTASSCLLHLLPPVVTAQRFLELPVCAAYTAELSKKRHRNELLLSKGLNSHY